MSVPKPPTNCERENALTALCATFLAVKDLRGQRLTGLDQGPPQDTYGELGQPAGIRFVAHDKRDSCAIEIPSVSVEKVSKSLRISKAPPIRPKLLAEIGSLICSGETFDGEGCSADCGQEGLEGDAHAGQAGQAGPYEIGAG